MKIQKSLALKIALGNYQMADLFCAAEAECPSDAAELMGETLHAYCRAEIVKDYNKSLKFLADLVATKAKSAVLNPPEAPQSDLEGDHTGKAPYRMDKKVATPMAKTNIDDEVEKALSKLK